MVKGSPQAGFYFPSPVYLYPVYAVGLKIPFDLFATDYVHLLEGGYMNADCAKALGKDKARCWDVGVLQHYLKTPLFVAQNRVDQNQVNDELLCPKELCNGNPHKATPINFMREYANFSKTALLDFASHHANGSVFSPSCFSHTGDLNMVGHPKIQDKSYRDTLRDWYFNDVRTVLIDPDCPPGKATCNPSC